MKTLHFERIDFERTGTAKALDRVVPAHGHRLFVGEADIVALPRSIRVVGKHTSSSIGMAECPLKATALLIADLSGDDGGVFRSFPLRGETIEGVRAIDVAEAFMVRVENASSDSWSAQPVMTVVGQTSIADPARAEEFFMPLRPRPAEESTVRRLRVPAKGEMSSTLRFPCACSIKRITTRSDSELDVSLNLQLANVNLAVCDGPLPVEFFYGGVEIRTFRVAASNSLRVFLCNSSDSDRYVEIDVGVESARANQGESATR